MNLLSLMFFSVAYLIYMDAGMDAQIAYGFHHLRNEKPYLAQGPFANKVWLYFCFSCFWLRGANAPESVKLEQTKSSLILISISFIETILIE